MSNTGFKVRFDENGDIVDILGGCLKSTPEEKSGSVSSRP